MHSIALPCVTIIFVLLSVAAKAQDINSPESSWTDLTDQPSRKELFDNVIKASLEEDSRHHTPPNLPSFAIPKDFFFPDDARFDKILNKPRDKAIFGIDISHHDEKPLNLGLLRLQKVDFVYVKATQGVKFKDSRFDYYWKALAGLSPEQRPLRGAYHFLSALDDGREQAERFVQYVSLHGGFQKDDLPPCMDLEWDVTSKNPDQWKGQSPEKILDSVIAWLKRTKELTGRTPLVYTARSWWLERGIPESKFALLNEYPIWIADYSRSHKASEKPGILNGRTQSIWQFADDAKLTLGYTGTLDANIFYGSRDEFNKAFGVGH